MSESYRYGAAVYFRGGFMKTMTGYAKGERPIPLLYLGVAYRTYPFLVEAPELLT